MDLKNISDKSLTVLCTEKQKEVNAIKQEIKNRQHCEEELYVLKLRVGNGNILQVYYKTPRGKVKSLGFISHKGGCSFLNSAEKVKNYEKWLEKGMKANTIKVIYWNNAVYMLNKDIVLTRCHMERGRIYSFPRNMPFHDCKDSNIMRHKNNYRPILF